MFYFNFIHQQDLFPKFIRPVQILLFKLVALDVVLMYSGKVFLR